MIFDIWERKSPLMQLFNNVIRAMLCDLSMRLTLGGFRLWTNTLS